MSKIKEALIITALLALGVAGIAGWALFCFENVLSTLGRTPIDFIIFMLVLLVPPVFIASLAVEYIGED